MSKDLKKRTLSAIVFLSLVVGSILLGQYYYLSVFTFFTFVVLRELFAIFEKQGYNPRKNYATAIGLFIFLIAFFVAQLTIPATSYFISIFFVIWMFIIELYQPQKHHFRNIAISIFCIVYAVTPLATLHFIAFSGLNQDQYTPQFLLAMFSLIWTNDAGAYLIGSAIGKRKLLERISPGKTVEGTLGGGMATVLIGIVISLYIKNLTMFQWILFSIITSIFSTYGDLVESLLKRQTGVKDSGNIMPGHGGLLDRFDSTFFVAPMIFLYLKMIEYFF